MLVMALGQNAANVAPIQTPIYYVSKALQNAEARYSEIEKLALALVVAARKLRPYFQAHVILVPTSHLLRQVLQADTFGRLTKWAIELGEFDIKFMPRMAIKGQALADFVVEFTYPTTILGGAIYMSSTSVERKKDDEPTDLSNVWSLRIDSSSNVNESGTDVILESPKEKRSVMP